MPGSRANVPSKGELEGLDEVARAKLWQMRKYEAGWACIRWPREYGGRGASAMQQVIWNQEEASVRTPASVFAIGQGMAAPTMMSWATEEQKRRYLPPLASGEHVWCQLFSEPAGGSDLAALRTRAEKDGDEWVVNGQKIWTSGAHFSDYAILVVRTDPEVPKHKGLTYFFVDMKSSGIEVKPIRQISGDSNFNEVYFTDVRIPDAHRLGAVGQGWQVAITTLMNERAAIGGGGGLGFTQVFELAQRLEIDGRPAIEDRAVRARLADWYVQEAGLRFHRLPVDVGPVEGRTSGAGELHREIRRRIEVPGHGLVRNRPAGDVRRRLGPRTVVAIGHAPGDVHGCSGHAHRRRHRRDHAQHPRRARARHAAGPAGRQGDSIQQDPDQRFLKDFHGTNVSGERQRTGAIVP